MALLQWMDLTVSKWDVEVPPDLLMSSSGAETLLTVYENKEMRVISQTDRCCDEREGTDTRSFCFVCRIAPIEGFIRICAN